MIRACLEYIKGLGLILVKHPDLSPFLHYRLRLFFTPGQYFINENVSDWIKIYQFFYL